MQDYEDFLESKKIKVVPSGFDCKDINPKLFKFQHDIVCWALRKGKACIFAGTGLGKTPMQLEWARQVCNHTGGDVLILAPLAVASQTVREGEKFGIKVKQCRSQADVESGINIANYEILHKFDPSHFVGIVLDESSILKSFEGKFRNLIIESFQETPYKLACTATPSPNDTMELMNHAEFLGVMSRTEALAMWFVHDGGRTSQWRLKGHAIQSFWSWVASWAVMMNMPSDLGYDDNGFILPPLNIHQIIVDDEGYAVKEAQTLQDRRRARTDSIDLRVSKVAEIVNGMDESWLVWCDLNKESDMLTKAIKGAIDIKGSHDPEYKSEKMNGFSSQNVKILVTKPSIAGFGMNWQHCHNMVFTGLSDSFEQYYQAVRRCWRFGQTQSVNVYVVTSIKEGAVVKNIERKEKEFGDMLHGMISATQEITRKNIQSTIAEKDPYEPTGDMIVPSWLVSETYKYAEIEG